MTTKEKVLSVMNSLDENASLDEVIDRLHLLRKIELGIAQADAGDVIDHDQFMAELELTGAQKAELDRQLAAAPDRGVSWQEVKAKLMGE